MGRNSSRRFAVNRQFVIARDGGVCGICQHPGSTTADHIVPVRDWPRDSTGKPMRGLDEPENLQAAHGSRRNGQPGVMDNPCMECARLYPDRWPLGRNCNQTRGTAKLTGQESHSKRW